MANYKSLRGKVESICKKFGRDPGEVKIVGICKKQSLDRIQKALNDGLCVLGENYLQELKEKQLELPQLQAEDWHFVGRLQRNKVKQLLGRVGLIHSVDRWNLLDTIEAECRNQKINQNILLSVNLSGEATKSGFDPKDLKEQVERLTNLRFVKCLGLMTMPPLQEEAEFNRRYFTELRILLELLEAQLPSENHPMNILSMGTSQDYEVAIEEGAHLLRLGSILFGPRPQNNKLLKVES